MTVDEALQVHCPLYLLTSSEVCWKCGATQYVLALGTHNLHDGEYDVVEPGDMSELVLLSNVEEMPLPVFEYMAQKNQRYMRHYSRTAGQTYYANTCECGANFGDFYLFSEPGGAFFPDTDEAAAEIELEVMPFSGSLRFVASYSVGVGEYILKHAKRKNTA
jgi:hypothetical protein